MQQLLQETHALNFWITEDTGGKEEHLFLSTFIIKLLEIFRLV